MKFLDHTLDTPHSLGLLWTSDRPVAETYLHDNTQHSQEQTSKLPTGFEPAKPSERPTDPRLKRCGHWDRPATLITDAKFPFISLIIQINYAT